MYSANRPLFLITICVIIFLFICLLNTTYLLNSIKSEISTIVFAPADIRVSVIPQAEDVRKLKTESGLNLDGRIIMKRGNLELREKHHVPEYMLDLFDQWNYTREGKKKNHTFRPSVDVVKSFIPKQIVSLRHQKRTILSIDVHCDDCYRLIFEIPQNKYKGEIFVDGEFRIMSQIGNMPTGIERLLKIQIIEKYLKYPILIKSKHVLHKENTWESFNVTDSIKQILQRKITTKMERKVLSIEICVERISEKYFKDTNYYIPQKDKHFQLSLLPDPGSSYFEHKHPLLLLSYISKQKKKSKEGVSRKQEESFTKASIGAPLNHITFFKLSNKLENVISKENTEKYNSYKDLRNSENFEIVRKRAKFQNHRNKRRRRDAEISENDDDNNNVWDEGNKSFAEERTHERREKRFSNSCKRKPLYVDFAEINYDSWIVQPSGYEAYQCSGKCLYPVVSHLTPTKHAVIQALVHSVNPVKAHRSCCVPTKLDSISILYIDYKGILTYRFAYQNMVVRECGCR